MVATATERCTLKAVLSTPFIMPSNACVCLCGLSLPVCSGVLVCVAVSLVFSLGFCEWATHTPWYLVTRVFRSPYSLIENHPHFCTRSRSKTLDRKMLLGNRQNPIACCTWLYYSDAEKPDKKMPSFVFDLPYYYVKFNPKPQLTILYSKYKYRMFLLL